MDSCYLLYRDLADAFYILEYFLVDASVSVDASLGGSHEGVCVPSPLDGSISSSSVGRYSMGNSSSPLSELGGN